MSHKEIVYTFLIVSITFLSLSWVAFNFQNFFVLARAESAGAVPVVQLSNSQWEITINPATFSLDVQPLTLNHSPISISRGIINHRHQYLVSNLEIFDQQNVTWHWDTDWKFELVLENSDLLVTIHALSTTTTPSGKLHILRQPATAQGHGFILPLAEGHYVPKNHSTWETFLLHHFSVMDTTQNLSLPLWGMDHGEFSLHWILTNPFNNRLHWERDPETGRGLQLSLYHEFVNLDNFSSEPFTAILHLSEESTKSSKVEKKNTLLQGARRYREWKMERKTFEPMSDKLAQWPEGKKLLGATHLYLWGNGPLDTDDVLDWPGLINRVSSGETQFHRELFRRMGGVIETDSKITEYQKQKLIRDLNEALSSLAREQWQLQEIDYDNLGSIYQKLFQSLAQHFSAVLTQDQSRWGQGFSLKTIEDLEKANLTHLWIGVAEGWEGALWKPAVVDKAVQAGYLIAPYDSYQDALPMGEIPEWTTAHLGEEIHRKCGILGKDSNKPQEGFQGQGVYTNPKCVRPALEKRIQKLKEIVGFNSWFLDSYGTGMLFDDHQPGATMTQKEMAGENEQIFRWTANTFGIPVGSENGNAVTSGGLMFAHGMQTPVIGDEVGSGDDLQNNQSSPFYFGDWYPPEEPRKFFRPSPLHEIHRVVHFDHRYRLPLYQTVFHDSLITTHHWLHDNPKIPSVATENTLVQLLYNLPPLFHISKGTFQERLPVIMRMDNFFKPLHQRLATKALVDFRWLNGVGSLQETLFSDGTTLIANFGNKPEVYHCQYQDSKLTLPPHSVTAVLSEGHVLHYEV